MTKNMGARQRVHVGEISALRRWGAPGAAPAAMAKVAMWALVCGAAALAACSPSAAECAEDGECARGELCLAGFCEPDDDACGGCPDGTFCDGDVCQPDSCTELPGACPTGYECDVDSDLCVEEGRECTPSEDTGACDDSEVCESGQCVTAPERTLLSIEDVSLEVGSDELEVQVAVRNDGVADTTSVAVHAYAHRDSAPGQGDEGDVFEVIDTLSSGATTTVALTVSDLDEGSYQAWVQVDPHRNIHDGSPGDVLFGPESYEISSEPDLLVSSFDVTPASNGELHFEVTVENAGGSVAENFDVRFYAGGDSPPLTGEEGDGVEAISSLAPGNQRDLAHTVTGLLDGVDQAWVVADGGGVVSDPNRENNLAGPRRYAVGLPHLGVVDFDVTGGGGTASWTATVENFGSEPSDFELGGVGPEAHILVEFYEERANAPEADDSDGCGFGGDVGDDVVQLSHIGPGATATATSTHEVETGGNTLRGWVQVDRGTCTRDPDHTNNIAGPVTYDP